MRKRPGPISKRSLRPSPPPLGEASLGVSGAVVPAILLHVVLTIKLIVIESRHKIDSLLHHQLDITVVKIDAMLDRLHTGIQAISKTFAAKSMTRDLMAFFVSLVHNCRDFLRCEGGRNHHLPV